MKVSQRVTSLTDKVDQPPFSAVSLYMLCVQHQSRTVVVSASQLLTSILGVQIDKCFGFESAVEESQRALLAGYVEAASAKSGLGLIKLMGRQSGYIAMQASMASGQLLPAASCLPVCSLEHACSIAIDWYPVKHGHVQRLSNIWVAAVQCLCASQGQAGGDCMSRSCSVNLHSGFWLCLNQKPECLRP